MIEGLAHAPSTELLDEALANENCIAMIQENSNLKYEVKRGKHGKTANFKITRGRFFFFYTSRGQQKRATLLCTYHA